MIVKCSGLTTGQTITASFYDVTTTPETLIAAAGGAMTEEGATGVYTRDVTDTLDNYERVRVHLDVGGDGWIAPEDGTVELAIDPALLGIGNIDTINGLPVEVGPLNLYLINQTNVIDGTLEIIRSADYLAANDNLVHVPGLSNINGADDLLLSIVNKETETVIVTRVSAADFDEGEETADFPLTAAQSNAAASGKCAFIIERKKTVTAVDYYNALMLGPVTVRSNNRQFP